MTRAEIRAHKIGNRPLCSRVSYLLQAATYFQSVHTRTMPSLVNETVHFNTPVSLKSDNIHTTDDQEAPGRTSRALRNACSVQDNSLQPQAVFGVEQVPLQLNTQRHLISQLRAVASKGQIQLARQVKHRFCKKCDAILDDTTSSCMIENDSKGGKKPWADVCVVKCLSCNAAKRCPIGAARQVSRSTRAMKGEAIRKNDKKF